MIKFADKFKSIIKIRSFFNFANNGNKLAIKGDNNKVMINSNDYSLESFEATLETLKERMKNYTNNSDLDGIENAFNKAERYWNNCKNNFPNNEDVRSFPCDTVKNYYDLIISIKKRDGVLVDQYEKKLNYYKTLCSE